MATRRFLEAAGIKQEELARALGLSEGAVSRKIAGHRPWLQREIDIALAFFSERLGRQVTYEEAFGTLSATAADLVVHEAAS